MVHRVSRFGIVNAYLVEEDDGLTLIDTMIPRSTNKVVLTAKGLGKPIVRIVDLFPQTPHIECVALLEAGPRGVANPERDA
jgi:hypothetical protein